MTKEEGTTIAFPAPGDAGNFPPPLLLTFGKELFLVLLEIIVPSFMFDLAELHPLCKIQCSSICYPYRYEIAVCIKSSLPAEVPQSYPKDLDTRCRVCLKEDEGGACRRNVDDDSEGGGKRSQ